MERHFGFRFGLTAVLAIGAACAALMLLTRVLDSALPSGEVIAFSPLAGTQRTLWLLDLRTETRVGVATFPDTATTVVGWSPNGRYYACWSQMTNAVHLVDMQTGRYRVIKDVPDESPLWSPDSRSLLFYGITPAPPRVDIYAVDVIDDTRRRLTNSDANDFDPVWSPNGKQIAFVSYASIGDSDIYLMDADGTKQRRLTALDTELFSPEWSPDGRQLLFFAGPDGLTGRLYVADLDTGTLRQIGPTQVFGANWSPDGARIHYRALDNGVISGYEADLSSGTTAPMFPANAHYGLAFWSRSGRKMAFASDMAGPWGIFVANADRSEPRGITFSPYAFRTIDWSSDETRIVFDSPVESDRTFTVAAADGSWLRQIDSGGVQPHPQWQP